MPDCLHCRLWDAVAAEAGDGQIDGGTMFRALAEMIADLLARMSEDAASARFLELQILTLAMERAKRQRLGTAGQDMAATVQGVCGHG
mgnify:CR=1 FL=1